MKDLTELGFMAASGSYARRSLTGNEFIKHCKRFSATSIDSYSSLYGSILWLAKNNDVMKELFKYLYKKGISGVHYVNNVTRALEKTYPSESVQEAIDTLVKEQFLIKTGLNWSALFPKDPAFAHFLCLLSAKPEEYQAPSEFFKLNGRLILPLTSSPEDDNEE